MVNLTYTLDPDWRIIDWYSPDGSCLDRGYLGTSILSVITDATLRHLFDVALERVYRGGESLTLELRCDTARLRRESFVRLSRLELNRQHLVHVENGTLREAERPSVRILESGWARDGFLRMCSWCKKIDAGGRGWLEIEEAQRLIQFFKADPPPAVTHGMCKACFEYVSRTVAGMSTGATAQ
jgi:hypothetical protein